MAAPGLLCARGAANSWSDFSHTRPRSAVSVARGGGVRGGLHLVEEGRRPAPRTAGVPVDVGLGPVDAVGVADADLAVAAPEGRRLEVLATGKRIEAVGTDLVTGVDERHVVARVVGDPFHRVPNRGRVALD